MEPAFKKSWQARTSTGNYFEMLDGLRGIAILMVVAYHTFYTNPESHVLVRFIGGMIGQGGRGVQIFFILSGFLVSYPLFRQRQNHPEAWNLKSYAVRRFSKIIPPYYLSIAILTTYFLFRTSDPVYCWIALKYALGLANFIRTTIPFNPTYWFVIIVVQFYILAPLLFRLCRRLQLLPATMCMVLILLLVPLVVRQLTWPAQRLDVNALAFLMERFPCQFDYFAWGVLFSGILVSLQTLRDKARALSFLGYAGAVLFVLNLCCGALASIKSGTNPYPTRWSTEMFHLSVGISVFLLLFFTFDPSCLGSRLLAMPPLRFTGIISYEWYLFHWPIIVLFNETFGETHGSFLKYALKTSLPFALTFLFSALVYRYFSLPIANRMRSKWFRGQSSAAGSSRVS